MQGSDFLFYGIFIFMSIYAYTELMGKNPMSFWQELVKNALGLIIFYSHGGWFALNELSSVINLAVPAYFVIATLFVAYFTFVEFKKVPLSELINEEFEIST